MKFAVIGSGAWGTTLADLLARNGNRVSLWAREPEVAEGISKNRRNPLFVPELEISTEVRVFLELEESLQGAEGVILAVPSAFLRSILKKIKGFLKKGTGILNVAKGFERETGFLLSKVILQELDISENSPEDKVGVLSGPNLASEVAARKPGATVIACPDQILAATLQTAFSSPFFRVYRHTDRTGVELGGTLKNIFAIGAGIVDGLGLGDNAKSAYLTRSIHEMVRLGTRLGGRNATFYGLSGLGDLMATAASPLSRNHMLGKSIARNEKEQFLSAHSKMVIEGIETTKMARDWGKKLTIPLPITEEINKVLFENKNPMEAAKDLMTRSLKDEEE